MKLKLIFLALILPSILFAQFKLKTILPEKVKNAKHLYYTDFEVLFDTVNCIPVYSAYILTNAHLNAKTTYERATFKNDKKIKCVTVNDYKNTGYDKGHLTPAADMNYSEESMHDCFYITNMCPQIHSFNAGIWKSLETQVREWAIKYDSLVIISAPVIQTSVVEGKLNVPVKFYKIIYSVKNKKAVAFLMDAKINKGSIYDYEVTIKEVDNITKINYFSSKSYSQIINSIDKEFWK